MNKRLTFYHISNMVSANNHVDMRLKSQQPSHGLVELTMTKPKPSAMIGRELSSPRPALAMRKSAFPSLRTTT
jgi:hypothetical protein